MQRFIENVSMFDIRTGFHMDAGPNAMLIQIVDPGFPFPVPKREFKETHQFEFLDSDDSDGDPEDQKIDSGQAKKILHLLLKAKEKQMNVVVHCHAGICRSGAVTEMGVILGFVDPEKYRAPNLRVKRMLVGHYLDHLQQTGKEHETE